MYSAIAERACVLKAQTDPYSLLDSAKGESQGSQSIVSSVVGGSSIDPWKSGGSEHF